MNYSEHLNEINQKSATMFRYILCVSILFFLTIALRAQTHGTEFRFSLVVPELHRSHYTYSTDPTFEVLYFTSTF